MDVLGKWTLDRVVNTDALSLLRGLPDGSVHCAVTSPPYFGLRSYTDGDTREVGKEETPEQYVAALVEVFRELRRVLRDDGTLWLNLGDSFANDGKWGGSTGGKHASGLHGNSGVGRQKRNTGIAPKSLIGIPWMVAFALRADGWILRSAAPWLKANAMPESVEDRCTTSHEYVFQFAKRPTYYFDAEAVKVKAVNGDPTAPRGSRGVLGQPNGGRRDKQGELGKRTYTGFNDRWDARAEPLTARNRRTSDAFLDAIDGQIAELQAMREAAVIASGDVIDLLNVTTRGFPGAHFAVMPEKLVEPCILAGCPETVCAVCGAPYERVVEREVERYNEREGVAQRLRNAGATSGGTEKVTLGVTRGVHVTSLGFAPTCTCNAGTTHGVVVDPFGGAGTIGVVARRLRRHYILSEINSDYVAMTKERIAGVTPLLEGFSDTRASYDTTDTSPQDFQLRLLPEQTETHETV